MSSSSDSKYSDDQLEVVQAVLDRMTSYQEGATDGTVESELSKAIREAGVELEPSDVTKLAAAIEGVQEGDGAVQAADVLG